MAGLKVVEVQVGAPDCASTCTTRAHTRLALQRFLHEGRIWTRTECGTMHQALTYS